MKKTLLYLLLSTNLITAMNFEFNFDLKDITFPKPSSFFSPNSYTNTNKVIPCKRPNKNLEKINVITSLAIGLASCIPTVGFFSLLGQELLKSIKKEDRFIGIALGGFLLFGYSAYLNITYSIRKFNIWYEW